MVYLFLLELFIHRLGDPKCVVSEISGCSDMSVVIRYFMVSVRRTGTFLVYIYIHIHNVEKVYIALQKFCTKPIFRVYFILRVL